MGYFIKNRGLRSDSSGVGLPTGDTSIRPDAPVTGLIRFNEDTSKVEVYNGSGWEPVGPNYATTASQVFVGTGIAGPYTLDQAATTETVIVSINGAVQQPTTAYSVTGTDITFTEVITAADEVEVRFIAEFVLIDYSFDAGIF